MESEQESNERETSACFSRPWLLKTYITRNNILIEEDS